MSLETSVSRFLLDLLDISKNSITINLQAARTLGELNIDDATFRALIVIVEKTLHSSFDGGVSQASSLLKNQ